MANYKTDLMNFKTFKVGEKQKLDLRLSNIKEMGNPIFTSQQFGTSSGLYTTKNSYHNKNRN